MTPIEQNWINYKTHFHTAHRKLGETGELTMEYCGYHQVNLVNDIVAHMYGLPFLYPPQEPAYTLIPNNATTIVLTFQPTIVANVATYAVSNILPQLLTSMQQMQQLMMHMKKNQTRGGGGDKSSTTKPNWTKTRATAQALTRLCKQIFLGTREVCTRRRRLEQQIDQVSGYKNLLQQAQ